LYYFTVIFLPIPNKLLLLQLLAYAFSKCKHVLYIIICW